MNKSDEIQNPNQNTIINTYEENEENEENEEKRKLEGQLSKLFYQLTSKLQDRVLGQKEIASMMEFEGDIGKFTLLGLEMYDYTAIQDFLKDKGVTSLIGNVKTFVGSDLGLKFNLNCTQLEEVLGKITAEAAEQTPAPRMWCNTGGR